MIIDTGVVLDQEGLVLFPAAIQASLLEKANTQEPIVTGEISQVDFSVILTNGIESLIGELEIDLPLQIELTENTYCEAYEEVTHDALGCHIFRF